MNARPLALVPEKANEQHYEVPAEFFGEVLGSHRKYSGCFWPQGVDSLDEAEARALAATCERAELRDGQDVLELGCGWGSLTLWIAQHYPASRITAISNSQSQRAYIEAQARKQGLGNVNVITCDMNGFDTDGRFDRIVSVEMFEHMRNWPDLFRRVNTWLKPDGRFFMHVFAHRSTPYAFVERDESDWMSKYFFSGGMMPSDELALNFQDHLRIVQRWRWDGTHYERTSNAWLENMDAHRDEIWPVLEKAYGKRQAAVVGHAGACSSWRARSCSVSTRGRNGGSATTCLPLPDRLFHHGHERTCSRTRPYRSIAGAACRAGHREGGR